MGFCSNGLPQILMHDLNFIPNLRGNCCSFGGTTNFFLPSGFGTCCTNPLFNLNFGGLPVTYGDTIGLDAGLGMPNYLNGTFTPFAKSMALPFLTPNFRGGCCCGTNQYGNQNALINNLVQLIAMKSLLEGLKQGMNEELIKHTGKLDIRDTEIKYIADTDVTDDEPDDVDDISSEKAPESSKKEPKSVTKKTVSPVKLTDKLSLERDSIIYGVKNTWYGTRDQWSEASAISKMEELDDDTFISMFADESYAETMASYLSQGSNSDGVMAYIIKRLHGLAPKDVKIYADTEWADSFVVTKNDIHPEYSHELRYCENIMNGFEDGVDIYEGDFKRAVIDLGRYIREYRYN